NDEFDNAARAVRLNAARSLAPRHFRAPRVADIIRSMLDDSRLAAGAAALGARLAAEDGARAAADAILG
ncbi:MAG: glycosyltransferase, partial [Planctomycetota bacterium]|nr:glycosyltransferase [Planctomycetota bacterium]